MKRNLFFLSIGFIAILMFSCTAPKVLTLLTYNAVEKNEYTNIAFLLNYELPDIVALQGVDYETEFGQDSDAITIFKQLSQKESGFTRNILYDEDAKGVGILTDNLPLESFSIPLPGRVGNPVALIHQYSDCIVVSAQFPHDLENQLKAVAVVDSVAAIFAPLRIPIIIAGTMPFERDSEPFRRMTRNYGLLNETLIAEASNQTEAQIADPCYDYIWVYTGSGISYYVWRVETMSPIWEGTVNKPVIVTFRYTAPKKKNLTPYDMEKKKLTDFEKYVIVDKGTEPPFTGEYCDLKSSGIYLCKQCGAPLYRSVDKFSSGCGWPSFDDEIDGAVRRTPDPDGRRTEITCAKCGGHLGHVFEGEGFTPKNTRHCINSVSLTFVPDDVQDEEKTAAHEPETAYFAGGCFWGVEHLMQKQEGVISVESGYMGGTVEKPTYEQVCSHGTGHAEVVKVTFDPGKVSYLTLAKLFFEIHDPTQQDRQGPDIGEQYRSEVFYTTPQQKATAERLIKILRQRGYDVVTEVTPATTFWKAEDYHQDYYERKGTQPYCHKYTKRFD